MSPTLRAFSRSMAAALVMLIFFLYLTNEHREEIKANQARVTQINFMDESTCLVSLGTPVQITHTDQWRDGSFHHRIIFASGASMGIADEALTTCNQ